MAMKPIGVTQLNKYIGRVLQTDPILGNVSVVGEISNLKYHSTGHVYFTLKDEGSRINCFLPARTAAALRYQLTDGMQVVIIGYIAVFEKGGYYSLNVRDVEISGTGNLMAAYRALFERLQKEGLFDESRKKPLPSFPKKIAVVTSPTGAAVRDILKILRTRNHVVQILVYPCLVQGPAAAGEIAAAIADINARFIDVELIITGRGGGSLEELWAFNEEIVARSIAASEIPVISAVGHETDFSISDYAADVRAETPTAAAMMAVPDTAQLDRELERNMNILETRLKRCFTYRQEKLKHCSLPMLRKFLVARMIRNAEALERQQEGIKRGMRQWLERAVNDMEKCRIRLAAGNPEKILRRGYAIVSDPATGKLLTDAAQLQPQDSVSIRLRDGSMLAEIREIQKGTEEDIWMNRN